MSSPRSHGSSFVPKTCQYPPGSFDSGNPVTDCCPDPDPYPMPCECNFTFVDAWVSFMADPHVTRFSISASCANSSSATTTRVLLAPKHITRDVIITRTMGFVLLRLFAVRLAFFRDDDDDDDVLRSDDMMMKEKSGSRYDSSVSTFADVDVLFARSTKAARVLSLSLSLSLSRARKGYSTCNTQKKSEENYPIERDLLLLSKTDRRRREGKALVPGGSSRMVVSDFHSRY